VVQTFTSEFIDAARPARHAVGSRWFVDETYVKVAGRWTYLYPAIVQHGQVIDVLVCERFDGVAARAFFTRALKAGPAPVEVTTDRAPVYPRVMDELAPAARHVLEQYTNNSVEADHGRLKARLRPMRGMKTIRSLRVVAAGHAFMQNLRCGHYELTTELPARDRLAQSKKSRVAVAVTPGHAITVTHERPPYAWDTKPAAHQEDVPTSGTDTQNVFLSAGSARFSRDPVGRYQAATAR
jgi:IS6 family transposase